MTSNPPRRNQVDKESLTPTELYLRLSTLSQKNQGRRSKTRSKMGDLLNCRITVGTLCDPIPFGMNRPQRIPILHF